MKIGILREGKTPPDKRVPLTPKQCRSIIDKYYPAIEIVAQPSEIRAIKDVEYTDQGIKLTTDLTDCDVILGVKEVPLELLIPNKKYFFFSHTIKKQPYNRNLLRRILELKIELIDYETLTYKNGARVLGFGKFAGVVGTYNTLLGFGLKSGKYNLKPAHQCKDFKELKQELEKVKLPSNYKIILTGKGRVGGGALEILRLLKLKEVSAADFLNKEANEPVYTVLDIADYFCHKDGTEWNAKAFFNDSSQYQSTFMLYAKAANMYVACHYWEAPAPFIFTRDDVKSNDFKIDIIGDISCDIDGPVASTLRSSTIAKPFYGYNPQTEKEVDYSTKESIMVMAVDNLPCELPRDASEGFGQDLCDYILPCLINSDEDKIIERATITKEGLLTDTFSYLQDYAEGTDLVV